MEMHANLKPRELKLGSAFSLCVRAFVCSMWISTSTCIEVRDRHPVSSLVTLHVWGKVLHWTWCVLIQSDWLVSKPQGSFCLCLPRPGITAACRHLHLFLHRLCGFRTQILVLVWHTLYPLSHLPKLLLSPWTRYVSCLHFSYLKTHIYTLVANHTHKSIFSILQTQWHASQSVGEKEWGSLLKTSFLHTKLGTGIT